MPSPLLHPPSRTLHRAAACITAVLAAALGYVPLPPAIQQLAATTLAQVTGPDGNPLTG